MRNIVGVLALVLLLFLTGCGGQVSAATEMVLASDETPHSPTATLLPSTATLPPTATPPPTATKPPTLIQITSTPTATIEPSPEPFEGIVVTYNGSGCTISGPTDLTTGDHQFFVENLTKDSVSLRIYRNLCGHTFQELVEIQGDPGRNFLPGEFLFDAPQTEHNMERIPTTTDFIYTYALHTAGEYSVALHNPTSQNYWLCAPLEVTEGSEPIPPTATPEISSCEGVDGTCLELTFDGDSCTYVGPTEFNSGPVTWLFINASDVHATVNLMRHLEGKTIQDMLARFSDGVSKLHHPDWTEEVNYWKAINPGMNLIWRGELQPGIHTMVCITLCPWLVYFGTGFTVGE